MEKTLQEDGPINSMRINRKILCNLFLFISFLLVHIYLSRDVDFGRILGDEAGYYSNARFFALGGNLPELTGPDSALKIQFYFPGYSLLLTPLFF